MRTERFLPRPGGVPAVPRAEDSRMTVNRAFVVGALFLALSLAPATAFRVEARPADAATQRALVDRYCVGCHNDRITSGNLRLDDADLSTVGEHGELWERVVQKLRGGLMPPPGRPRPEPAVYEGFASWLEAELDRAAAANPNPGRTETFHRLNRTEYQNIVRDLLAIDMDFNNLLPIDDSGGGDAPFDNIASSLRLTQSLMEVYLSVANRVTRLAVGGAPPEAELQFRVHDDLDQRVYFEGMPFGTRGGLLVDHIFAVDGEYEIEVGVRGGGTGHIELALDGERIALFDVVPRRRGGGEYAGPTASSRVVRIPIEAGPRQITAAFVNEGPYLMAEGDRKLFFGESQGFALVGGTAIRLPGIDDIWIKGPLAVTGKGNTPSRERIFVCYPQDESEEEPCARTILSTLAGRAYRRPLSDRDVSALMNLYAEGRGEGDFEEGIRQGIRAVLVNPHFLFRIENDPANLPPNRVYRISDLELASRLSFFLWSSIPDDELLDLAADGRLREPGVLEAQVRRMLADERSAALTTSFAAQWLWVRNLDEAVPSEPLFPNFDEPLKRAFRREMELFFDSIVQEDRSVVDLLDADYTFVNERLASHYGIPYIVGTDFRRVQLAADSPRRGLLGKGLVLLVTSQSTRTSPVVRGKWILENLLGTPPPAPPANVPPLSEQKQDDGRVLTVHELMAQHRANPVCASCHATIDPAGFALEQFDATGKWREVDVGFQPIDASGTMPDGTPFGGIHDFRDILMKNPDRFVHTMTDKLLMYAIGRGTEYYDAPAIRQIVREAAASNYRFLPLVTAIVNSAPFQMRRAADGVTQVASDIR